MPSRRANATFRSLALVAVLAGAATTILLDQVRLQRWARGGVRVPLGGHYEVALPAGDMHVYYESQVAVPAGEVLLVVRDAEGAVVRPDTPEVDQSFRLLLGGRSGRALWSCRDLAGGPYTVAVTNPHYGSDEEIPADDRVVFAKRPDTLDEVRSQRRVVHVAGASITMLAVAAFYGLHARTARVGTTRAA